MSKFSGSWQRLLAGWPGVDRNKKPVTRYFLEYLKPFPYPSKPIILNFEECLFSEYGAK